MNFQWDCVACTGLLSLLYMLVMYTFAWSVMYPFAPVCDLPSIIISSTSIGCSHCLVFTELWERSASGPSWLCELPSPGQPGTICWASAPFCLPTCYLPTPEPLYPAPYQHPNVHLPAQRCPCCPPTPFQLPQRAVCLDLLSRKKPPWQLPVQDSHYLESHWREQHHLPLCRCPTLATSGCRRCLGMKWSVSSLLTWNRVCCALHVSLQGCG